MAITMKHYGTDPALISLEQFRELTAGREMLPGRTMLQDRMEERFALLKASGLHHLGDLLRVLSSGQGSGNMHNGPVFLPIIWCF